MELKPEKRQAKIVDLLKIASSDEYENLLLNYLQQQVLKVLGLSQLNLPQPQQSLTQMGFDSLMIMELKNIIMTELGVNIPTEKLINRFSLLELADLLVEQISLLNTENLAREDAPLIPLLPVKERNNLPLSLNQERLWYLAKFNPDSSVYNYPVAFRLAGLLNVAALEQSLAEIVRRQEILRTIIIIENKQPFQRILSNLIFKLSVFDLQKLPETDQETEVQQLLIEEARQPFKLEEKQLWRLKLIRLSEAEHLLLLTMHHMISDGWSLNIFLQELSNLYEVFSTSKLPQLPDLLVQYADFSLWQRQWAQGEVLESQLDYWKEHLSGSISELKLPIDRPRSRNTSQRGAYQLFVLPKDLTKDLKTLSEQEGVTLFMTLLTILKALLYQYTEQEDIIVCSPIACRNRVETKGLIGYFNNIVILRTNLSGNPTFQELLARVRRIASAAYDNQEIPLQKVAELPNLACTPLTRVMFVLQNSPIHSLKLSGITVSSLNVHNGMANFDLSLSMREEKEQLLGLFEYKTELFDSSTITNILENFETLLTTLITTPNHYLKDLPLLRKAQFSDKSEQPQTKTSKEEKPKKEIPIQKQSTLKALPAPKGARDLARYFPDGNIEFLGRIDNQVKIRGFRIELGEIEVFLNQHPSVEQTVVIEREDTPGEKRLVAYLVPSDQSSIANPKSQILNQLRDFLKQKLPDYMIPSAFVLLETLPLTPNGKVDRRALPAPDQTKLEPEGTFVAPRDELELQLTKILESVLGTQPIGIKDNFFDLGGHSLLAVRFVAEIDKAFDKKLPLATFFQAPTVEQLAKVLRDQEWKSSWYSLVPVQPSGSRPPLFGINHNFRDLSHYLGQEQPVYRLHYAIGETTDKEISLPTLENLAAHYIQEMRSLQPEGPYYLMGLSFGGVVAYEMAQQLVGQGQQVAFLGLFDTFIERQRTFLPLHQRFSKLFQLTPSELLRRIKTKIKGKLVKHDNKYLPHVYNFNLVIRRLEAYTPQVYSGRVTLFKAMNQISVNYAITPPEVGWRKFVNGELEIHEIPGSHTGITGILEEPNVKILAEKMRACIAKSLNNE